MKKAGFRLKDHGDCWRIEIFEHSPGVMGAPKATWFPLYWLRFATKEAAERHIDLHGVPGGPGPGETAAEG